MSYSNEDYLDGYRHGWEAGRKLGSAGDWIMLGLGFSLGLVTFILITVAL